MVLEKSQEWCTDESGVEDAVHDLVESIRNRRAPRLITRLVRSKSGRPGYSLVKVAASEVSRILEAVQQDSTTAADLGRRGHR